MIIKYQPLRVSQSGYQINKQSHDLRVFVVCFGKALYNDPIENGNFTNRLKGLQRHDTASAAPTHDQCETTALSEDNRQFYHNKITNLVVLPFSQISPMKPGRQTQRKPLSVNPD